MLTKIDVTEEDIRHAEHGSCSHCMLGVGLNKVLNDKYGCSILLSYDYDADKEHHRSFSIAPIEADTTHERNGYVYYDLDWRVADEEIFTTDFPAEAAEAADKFEGVGDYTDEGESRDIKPFSFYLDIPEKYLRIWKWNDSN